MKRNNIAFILVIAVPIIALFHESFFNLDHDVFSNDSPLGYKMHYWSYPEINSGVPWLRYHCMYAFPAVMALLMLRRSVQESMRTTCILSYAFSVLMAIPVFFGSSSQLFWTYAFAGVGMNIVFVALYAILYCDLL